MARTPLWKSACLLYSVDNIDEVTRAAVIVAQIYCLPQCLGIATCAGLAHLCSAGIACSCLGQKEKRAPIIHNLARKYCSKNIIRCLHIHQLIFDNIIYLC